MKAPLIGICRHRLTIDGEGVTTLVAFHGCPLRCQYCLNSQSLRPDGVWQRLSVDEILEQVVIDDLYFQATRGGICFGGGEPLLRSEVIRKFCQQCPKEWNVYLETSLNVPLHHLQQVVPYITHFYIDIKDLSSDIYRRYCSADNARVMENLQYLADLQLQSRVTLRLPLIPNYNTPSDRQRSRQQLEEMGFTHFDEFEYIIPE